jgi:hypothetical protein
MKPTAEIVTHEGKQVLRLDFANKGVDIVLPAKPETVKAACSVLMMNLAGVSQSELETAALMAMMEAA